MGNFSETVHQTVQYNYSHNFFVYFFFTNQIGNYYDCNYSVRLIKYEEIYRIL